MATLEIIKARADKEMRENYNEWACEFFTNCKEKMRSLGRTAGDFICPSLKHAKVLEMYCDRMDQPIYHVAEDTVSIGLTYADLWAHEERR